MKLEQFSADLRQSVLILDTYAVANLVLILSHFYSMGLKNYAD
jgi:hypothetical protein